MLCAPPRLLALSTLLLAVCIGSTQASDAVYKRDVLPVMKKYCFECHNAETQEGEVRLDNLDPDLVGGKDAERWHHALDMLNQGDMPPEGEERPDPKTLERLTGWIQTELIKSIKAHRASNKAVMRRMTTQQYTSTLQELLGLRNRFGDGLPQDAKSKSGFSNNANVLQVTPLHLDYYEKIAREALDQAIFLEKPDVVRYRIKIGTNIGAEKKREKQSGKFGGFVSQPVDPRHLIAEVLDGQGRVKTVPVKPQPFGNVLHNLGIDMRGSHRDRYKMDPRGMLMDSGLPHVEKAPGAWHGPSPNLKMLIRRDFPMKGPFAFRVKAARLATRPRELPVSYRASAPLFQLGDQKNANANHMMRNAQHAKRLDGSRVEDGKLVPTRKDAKNARAQFEVEIPKTDLYQVEWVRTRLPKDAKGNLFVEIPPLEIKLNQKINFKKDRKESEALVTSVGIVFLPQGKHTLQIRWNGKCNVEAVVLTPLPADHKVRVQREEQIQAAKEELLGRNQRQPVLQVSLGNRTDDGQDAQRFDQIQKMTAPVDKFHSYQFVGRLENLPTPQLDLNELTSLSNILVLTVWNGDFVKASKEMGSSIVVSEVEFEAPYYPQWPPQSHRQIFIESPNRDQPEKYAREVLETFVRRAFRRPLREGELELYYRFWQSSRDQFSTFEASIKETLVAVLCSPKFLYLAETRGEAKQASKREFELASKVAYFLWNGPPDDQLLQLAERGQLKQNLRGQVQRMVQDPRSLRFVRAFCDQWLKMNRHHEMQVDIGRYPQFTRYVKEDMAKETYHFVHHVLTQNLDIGTLIDSDFVMVNQNLAEFYGIEGVQGTDFRPVKVEPDQRRGGLLTQGAFLSGHSDGKQAHPIKRAVWLMERILGDSPPPPPPNVPDLDPKDPKNKSLSIAQQLALHRDSTSCRNCHKKLDPYGLVFEDYNGAGLLSGSPGSNRDTKVTLPDGATVDGVRGMKDYILKSKKSKFTTSLVEHLMTFALGRDMSYIDEQEIEELVKRVHQRDDRFQAVLEEIVVSRMFLD